jgi:hypothetical protein
VRVNVDRPSFALNPSSCEVKQATGDITAQDGSTATRTSRFQAGGCGKLAFKPRLTLALTGKKEVMTGKHPGVKATVAQKGVGEAAIKKATVRLPKALALDPANAQALCEFDQGTKPDLENHCPKGSIVGRATATTPLLNKPVSGNVYFVKNIRTDPKTGNQIRTLPMIVVALRGEIAINLKGESATTRGGQLVNTFNTVPDAPVSKFNLNIQGGKNGILAVTRTRRSKINLCSATRTAKANLNGQNGKQHNLDITVKTPCKKKKTKKRKGGKRR